MIATLAERIFLRASGPGAVLIGSGKPRRIMTALFSLSVSMTVIREFLISSGEKSPLRTSFVPIHTKARSGLKACAAFN